MVIPLPQCRRVYFVCWLVYCSISLASEGGTLSTRRNIDFIDSNPGVSAATAGAQDFIERFIGRFISVSERASGGTSWGGDPGQERVGLSFPQFPRVMHTLLAEFWKLDGKAPSTGSAAVCWKSEDGLGSVPLSRTMNWQLVELPKKFSRT